MPEGSEDSCASPPASEGSCRVCESAPSFFTWAGGGGARFAKAFCVRLLSVFPSDAGALREAVSAEEERGSHALLLRLVAAEALFRRGAALVGLLLQRGVRVAIVLRLVDTSEKIAVFCVSKTRPRLAAHCVTSLPQSQKQSEKSRPHFFRCQDTAPPPVYARRRRLGAS